MRDRHKAWRKRASTAALDSQGWAQLASFDREHHTARIVRPRVAMTNPRRLLERDIERRLRSDLRTPALPIIVTAAPDVASLLDAIDLHGETTQVRVPTGIVGSTDGSVALEGQITSNYWRDAERVIQYLSNAIGPRASRLQRRPLHVTENVEGALRWLPLDAFKE